jgi:hypothetical protein
MKKNVSHHLYCTVASSVSLWGIEWMLLPWDTRSSSLFRLLLCVRVSESDGREKRICLKIPLCLVLISEKNVFFFSFFSDISKWQICSIDEQSFSCCVYIRFTTIQGHFCSVELFNGYINGIVKDNNSLSSYCRIYAYIQLSRLFMRNDVWKKIFYRIKFVLVDVEWTIGWQTFVYARCVCVCLQGVTLAWNTNNEYACLILV